MIADNDGSPAPPYRAALLVGLALFALYVATLAPSTAFWDASEYIATAHIVGIPHPPGNPLFVILGRAWSLLLTPLGIPPAVAVNLLAAATSATASAFFFLVAHRVLGGLKTDRRIALWGAAAGALIGGTAFTVWNQSTVNEKVYTVSAVIVAAVCWLGVRWRDRRSEPGSERLILWAVFLTALGATNHLMSVLGAPALVVIALAAGAGSLAKLRFLWRAATLVAIGISFNFVLPVRAELDPVINEGDPTCESLSRAAVAIYTLGRTGCPDLAANLRREQYRPVPVTQRKAPIESQFENYYQYFDWQWARSLKPDVLPGGASTPFTVIFLGLGIFGLSGAWRADRATGAGLGALAATLTVGLVIYLNFRYGYSLSPEIADLSRHEVRERDYFYLVGFMFWGSLAGIGLARFWDLVVRRTRGSRSKGGELPGRRLLRAAPVMSIALIPLVLNWSWASRSEDYAARDWAYNLLMSVEPYAVLFTNGDNDTFPLWYVQEVEGIRQDVTVVVGQYLGTSWYVKQLQALTSPENQRPFDPEQAPGLYEDPGMPSRPIIELSHEILDAVAPTRLTSDLDLPLAEVVAVYRSGTVLSRIDQLTLAIVQAARQDRPIYFSSLGGTMTRLGLTRWAVRQGLALLLQPVRNGFGPPGWVSIGTPDNPVWVDVDRSIRLYRDIYSFRGLRERRIWPDRSVKVVWQFHFAASAMARAVQVTGGDRALVDSLRADSDHFLSLGEFGVSSPPTSEPDS